MRSRSFLIFFVLTGFLLVSCARKDWDATVEAIPLPATGAGKLYDVHVDQAGRIHIVGGEKYSRNDFFQSDDNGASWQLMHFDAVLYSNKAVYSIGEHNGSLYAGSFDGKMFKNSAGVNTAWELGLGDVWWYALTGISFNENGVGIAAGNHGIYRGVIVRFSENLNMLQNDTFPFAINDVAYLNNDVAYAVGYGALLQTKDAGATWIQLNLTDDNYRSIAVLDKDNIWTVGFNGTIAHITKEGSEYNKIKNGQNPFANGDRYIDIAFKGHRGFIVGEKGLVLQTEDGGKNWKKMKRFTKSDLRAVCFHPQINTVYFVGDDHAAFKYTP